MVNRHRDTSRALPQPPDSCLVPDRGSRLRPLHESTVVIGTGKGYKRPPLLNFFMTRYTASYAAEIAALSNASSRIPSPTRAALMALLRYDLPTPACSR
jgi:hypothetical protein